jgi:hypothetical protein
MTKEYAFPVVGVGASVGLRDRYSRVKDTVHYCNLLPNSLEYLVSSLSVASFGRIGTEVLF